MLNPYLEGNFAPIRRERTAAPLELASGAVPPGLSGTLYRIGPAPRFAPRSSAGYHWFDGDGMIDAFRFQAGQVEHFRRWVGTDKLRLEQEAGRALFGGIRDFGRSTALSGYRALGLSNLELLALGLRVALGRTPTRGQMQRLQRAHDRGNTHIVAMAGRLVALEESAAGWDIDPATLETRGRFTFNGVIDGRSMIAHPKLEPESGSVYTLGYSPLPPYLTYYAFDARGGLRFERHIDVAYPSMMHDFGVTATRAVFFHLPATFRLENLVSGRPIRWEPGAGASLGIVDRDDPAAPVRWIEIPPCYVFHAMNAYDDGDALVLDVALYPRVPLFDTGGNDASNAIFESAGAQLVRWRIDPARRTLRVEVLDDGPMEFPVVDARFAMRSYRYGWGAARYRTTDRRGLTNAIAFYDHANGSARHRELGAACFTSEPVFAPRAPTAPEGDGFVLAVTYDADRDRSELLVLDAQHPDRDPIAVLACPHRIPYGFHGSWVAAG